MDDGILLLRRRLAEDPTDVRAQARLTDEMCRLGEWKRTRDEQGHELIWIKHGDVWGRSEKTLTVTLRDAPLAELIEAGKYDHQNDGITGTNFQIEAATGERKLELLQFETEVMTKQVNAWVSAEQCNHATLKPLLAVGEQHPDEQQRVLIAALGSRWRNFNPSYPPYLGSNEGKRMLCLYWDGDHERWRDLWRFLVLRK